MHQSQITPGPWYAYGQFVIATDSFGILPDIYIAEIIDSDPEGRIASPEQQAVNQRMIAALPDLLRAAQEVVGSWSRSSVISHDAFRHAIQKLQLAIHYADPR